MRVAVPFSCLRASPACWVVPRGRVKGQRPWLQVALGAGSWLRWGLGWRGHWSVRLRSGDPVPHLVTFQARRNVLSSVWQSSGSPSSDLMASSSKSIWSLISNRLLTKWP